jgi:hypothetical protein
VLQNNKDLLAAKRVKTPPKCTVAQHSALQGKFKQLVAVDMQELKP